MTSIASLTDKAKSDTQTAIVTFIRNECRQRMQALSKETTSASVKMTKQNAIADLQTIAARIEQGEYLNGLG